MITDKAETISVKLKSSFTRLRNMNIKINTELRLLNCYIELDFK